MAEDLRIRFDGPALAEGSMDVRQLAPALLALGEMFRESHRLLYPDEPEVSLQIRATERGSFIVDAQLQQSLMQQVVALFSGDGATAVANVVAFSSALIGFLKAMGRRKIRSQEPAGPGAVQVTFDDGTSITVPPEVVDMAKSLVIRQSVNDFVEPLRSDGIDTLEVSRPGTKTTELIITKQDLPAFDVPRVVEEPIADNTTTMAVSLTSVAFADGNKWRLSDGDRTFSASIADEHFLNMVNADAIRFSKHDTLVVTLRTRQWRDTTGQLRSEHIVEQVQQHMPAARQVALPFEQPDTD